MQVHAFYHFRPVTAFLSVNYLDRFLSLTSLPVPCRLLFLFSFFNHTHWHGMGKVKHVFLFVFAATKWMAVSASVGGLFVFGRENGGVWCATLGGLAIVRTKVRVWTQNGSENGVTGYDHPPMETAFCHSLWLPRLFPCQAPFFFFFLFRVDEPVLLHSLRPHS